MGGQETKIRAQPAARPRAPAKCSGNAPQPELVTRPGEEHPCGVGTPATPAAATPRAPESAALRVVYEIHLIGGRERETATLGFALDDVLRDRDQGNRRLAVRHDRIDGLLVETLGLGPRAVEPHELRVRRLVRI